MPQSSPNHLAGARPSLREEQRALTRRRLLEAAETVFARRGYHGASVEEIAREAGATTGALYANFASKEELFLELFDQSSSSDVRDYSRAVGESSTPQEKARAGADHWMEILHERPHYFPLFIEFWSYAIREPSLRERFATRLRALRKAAARIVAEGAEQRGIPISSEAAAGIGLFITALGNGLALEKLADPDAVPDAYYGDVLMLIFEALAALSREQAAAAPSDGGSR